MGEVSDGWVLGLDGEEIEEGLETENLEVLLQVGVGVVGHTVTYYPDMLGIPCKIECSSPGMPPMAIVMANAHHNIENISEQTSIE